VPQGRRNGVRDEALLGCCRAPRTWQGLLRPRVCITGYEIDSLSYNDSRFMVALPGSRASPVHRIAHMEYPVALDDHLRIPEHQVAIRVCPEVRLSPAEDDRHDVHRHVVDQPQR